MTSLRPPAPCHRWWGGGPLIAGVILAAVTEAIASTILSLGRSGIMGDIAATPDEIVWLDIGYTALKLLGFVVAPWLVVRIELWRSLVVATAVIGLASAIAALTPNLHTLVALRMGQGFSGGVVLVAGQTLLFSHYPRAWQPSIQAAFAIGSVVIPASAGPALQGWLLDSQAWTWISFGNAPIAAVAVGLLLLGGRRRDAPPLATPFDWPDFVLLSAGLACITYVCSQGSRWNWFEEPAIVWLSVAAGLAMLALVVRRYLAHSPGLLDLGVFRTDDFAFAFAASFVAGAALYGSAYLIPAFAVSVLTFTPGAVGGLLLPGGALFVGALLAAAHLMQARGKPPIITVPFGILLLIVSMWMLSGSTSESGADELMLAVLLRGAGLGFLLLSITMVAFDNLPKPSVASGIGLFNLGRQIGGLIGVSALQTLIDHQAMHAQTVIAAHVTPGVPAVIERLTATTAMLKGRGMEADAAQRAALQFLGKAVAGQSAVMAFNAAFCAVAVFFVVAAPVLVATKIALARTAMSRRDKVRQQSEVGAETSIPPGISTACGGAARVRAIVG